MQATIHRNGIRLRELMKIVGLGYFFGVGLIFAPMFILFAIAAFVFGIGQERIDAVALIFLLPLFLGVQAVIFTLFIALGIKVVNRLFGLEISLEGRDVR